MASLFQIGCATITRGTTEQFKVESSPSAASVRLDTGETGLTPVTFTVPRKRDLIVTVSKEGYETVTRTIGTKIAGKGAAGLAGNALIGGVIGIGVDAVSGASLNHEPNPLIVNLQPVTKPAVAEAPQPAAPAAPTEAAAPVTPATASAPVAAPAPTSATEEKAAPTSAPAAVPSDPGK
ncbi:MAG: PEGA domain-containing protein [Candidatus Didemnitutus sp.]|nr:PEGA domain-containing protein [Candidatus Didemnitutus sp.]